MDWATHDHRPPPRAEPPRPTLLKPAWQATSPSCKVLTCALYRGVEGRVEVRAEYPNNDLIRSELVRDVVTARQIAAGWKDAAMAKGFAELSREDPPMEMFFAPGESRRRSEHERAAGARTAHR